MESSEVKRVQPVFLARRTVGVFDRLAARAVDCLIAAAIFTLFNALSYFLGVMACLAFVLLQDGWGGSVGKRLFALRVEREPSQGPATPGQSALRNVPFALVLVCAAVPAFWVLLVLVGLPLLSMEIWFVWRLESGVRLGDVLANTYVSDTGRRPPLTENIDETSGGAYN